jgi:hypothetical protein
MEDRNVYVRLRTMSHTVYAAKFEQTIIHQQVLLRQESQVTYAFTTEMLVVLMVHPYQ